MLGLVPTSRGEVALFGTPLDEFHDWQRIGFVPQRVTRHLRRAGHRVRRWWPRAGSPADRSSGPLRAEDRAAVRDAIEAVGLSDRARDGCATLSGGQQQRVLIARALAGDPDLLVLDEPTAGVDLVSQQAFADALGALVDRGATIMLVAHELGPLAPLIGRTVVMRDGRVAYDGAPVATAHEVEHAGLAGQGHHHPDLQGRPSDHIPVVTSPLDQSARRGDA